MLILSKVDHQGEKVKKEYIKDTIPVANSTIMKCSKVIFDPQESAAALPCWQFETHEFSICDKE
jgi:hypothetical protein